MGWVVATLLLYLSCTLQNILTLSFLFPSIFSKSHSQVIFSGLVGRKQVRQFMKKRRYNCTHISFFLIQENQQIFSSLTILLEFHLYIIIILTIESIGFCY